MKTFLLILSMLFTGCFITAQVDSTILDVINFESPYPHLVIDSSAENLWQIGVPQKSVLDSAYSPFNVIITDTLNTYTANDSSFFDIKIGNFNAPNAYYFSIFLNFKHKYETDTLKDGGFISVSYDNGLTFDNIIIDPNNPYDLSPSNSWPNLKENLYDQNDSLINGEFGFSGSSNGWITTWFGWHDIPVKSTSGFFGDTLIVRFNFLSDSIDTGKEGWMIDDINLVWIDFGSAIRDLPQFDFALFPNPSSQTSIIEIEDYKNLSLELIDLNGRILRQTNYSNSEVIQLDFKALDPGIYVVRLKMDDKGYGIKTLVIE